MRFTILFVALLIPAMLFAQASTAPNLRGSALTLSMDSFNKGHTATIAAGGHDTLTAGYINFIVVTLPTASDTITIVQGTHSAGVAFCGPIYISASPSDNIVLPVFLPVDSTGIVITSVKGCKINVPYRTTTY